MKTSWWRRQVMVNVWVWRVIWVVIYINAIIGTLDIVEILQK